MSLLIRDALLADLHGSRRGDIYVEGNRIVSVGKAAVGTADLVIDGRGKAVIPGLVNAHTHAAMVLFRGFADDMELMPWLQTRIWPMERHLTEEDLTRGARLAILEMIQSGTTTFNDMYFRGPTAARAAQELGIRATVSAVFFDAFEKKTSEETAREIEGALDALGGFRNVRSAVGPHAPYTVSLGGLEAAAKIAARRGIPVHTHLAETEDEIVRFRKEQGRGLIETLDGIGFLSERLIAAHALWLDDGEIRRLAERRVSVVHCPAANMKLCAGRSADGHSRAFPYPAMRAAGVRVALGTDGAAGNNSLDMFEAMKTAALLQKHATGDASALPAGEALELATLGGARALGIDAGRIEPGALADLAVIDLSKPYLVPGHNVISDLVYAARGDCVETVIIDGRVVMLERHVEGAERILTEAREAAFDLARRRPK